MKKEEEKVYKEVYKVNPIVIYPECILEKGIQDDCFKCDKKANCLSPRSMCINPYKDHKYGCPNYGRVPTCPPQMPCMFDQVFDMSDVYAIVTRFYLEQYFRDRRLLYPNVTEGMLRSNRYWQPKTISENDTAIRDYFLENPDKKDYVSTRFLECMGVDVVGTMKEVGIELKFPPGEIVYRIAFVAKAYEDVLEKYDFEVFEPKTDKKNGIRTLIKKR